MRLFRSNERVLSHRDTKTLGTRHSGTFTSFYHLNFPAQGRRQCGCASITRTFTPSCKIGLGHITFTMGPCRTFHYSIPGLDASLCFIINSIFYQRAVPTISLPRKIVIYSLGRTTRHCPRGIRTHCNTLTHARGSTIGTLGAVLTRSNLFICVPHKITIRHALRIIGVLHSSISVVMGHQILIILRRGTRTHLLFYSRTVSSYRFLAARIIRICTNTGTHLRVCRLRRARTEGHHFDGLCIRRRTSDIIDRCGVALANKLAHGHASIQLYKRNTRSGLCNYIVTSNDRRISGGALVSRTTYYYADGRLCGCIVSRRDIKTFTNHVLIHRKTRRAISGRHGTGLYTAGGTQVCARPVLRVCTSSIGYDRKSAIKRVSRRSLFCVRRHNVDHRRTGVLLGFTFTNRIVSTVTLRTLHSHLRRLIRGHFHNRLDHYSNYGLYGWRGCMQRAGYGG